jgi:hypothetical protein
MKCIPIIFSGREVTEAIFVIEMDEVLLAKMQCAGAASSICLNILSFNSLFSVAASTTKSAFETALDKSVWVVMFFKVEAFSASVKLPFATMRWPFQGLYPKYLLSLL